MPGVFVLPNQVHQTIEGFGACFNELGYDALQVLDDTARVRIVRDCMRRASVHAARSAACLSVQITFRGIGIRMPRRPMILG